MKDHSLKSITRRAKSAVASSRKSFASYELGDGWELFLKAIRRIDRVEDDARYLTTEEREAAYVITSSARTEIRNAWEHARSTAKERNAIRVEVLSLQILREKREAFAARGNWNLSGGR